MNLRVKKRNGRLENFNVEKINAFMERCCEALDGVSASEVIVDMKASFNDKIQTSDIDKSLELTTTQKIYKEPNYSYVAARVVLSCLYKEVLKESVVSDTFEMDYKSIFVKNIRRGVKDGVLDEKLLDYDLKSLADYIKPDRDWKFKYIGIKNIYDRYLLKISDKRIETPQAFYMRIAMGVCLSEPIENRENAVKELYDIYSNHLGMPSTPTLFNSGTVHSQLSSCFKGDALVTTAFGQLRISDVREGDLVLTQSGFYEQVLKTRRKKNDKKIVKLSFSKLNAPMFDFESTEDHKIYAIKNRNKKPEWVEAKDLEVGDEVVLGANRTAVLGEIDSKRLAKICAYYFKFGKCTDHSVSFEFREQDISFSHDLIEYLGNLDYKTEKIGQKFFVTSTDKDIIDFMSHLKNSGDSFFILNDFRRDLKKAFLEEVYKIYSPLQDKKIMSLDKNFIFSLHSVLISLGFLDYTISESSLPSNPSYPKAYVLTFEKDLNFENPVEWPTAKISSKEVSDYFGDVYDLEIDNDHSFVVNGAVVHNCYLSEFEDSIDGIFDGIWQEARKSKYAGGLGFHVSKIRGTNSLIKGTHGKSSGLIPWLKIINDMLVACNQAGKRKGSGCAYLEPWHIDVEDFIDLRKTAGEERRRCHDLNTALWMNDLFFKRLEEDKDWTLFCPSECPDLVDSYGKNFNEKYEDYEQKAESGEIRIFKKIKAKSLWKKVLKSLFETSHPWITFKDSSNIRYSNSHEGVIHGSNLCCVTGDQRVVTNKGLLTAKQLADNFSDEELFVVGRSKVEKSTPIAKTLESQPILRVNTDLGYTHKVTYDHPLWVKDKGWIQAQYLKVGDIIEIQQVPGLWGKGSNSVQPFSLGFSISNNFNANKYFHPDIEPMWIANRIQWCDFFSGLFHKHFYCEEKEEGNVYYYQCENYGFLKDMQIVFANFGMVTRLEKDKIIFEDNYSKSILKSILFESLDENINPKLEELYREDLSKYTVNDKNNFCKVESLTREENEDVYCLKVLSNDEKAWTCNGLVTKNTEIFLHTKHSDYSNGEKTKKGETAVCNLASIVLPNHLDENGKIDKNKLKNTIHKLIRGLDNVIDVNFYPTQEAKISNLKHRPIGLGTMGWAEVFIANKIPHDSERAVKFADELMEFISYHAIMASSMLAKERGRYSSYEGSKWSKNQFPIDTWNELMDFRDNKESKGKETLDWTEVRNHVKDFGMRNSNVMAIAPNASIAYQMGCEQSIEPFFQLLYVYENKSGMNTIINFSFADEMKKIGLWSESLANAIKEADGDIMLLKNIPEEIKELFKTAFDRDQKMLIKVNAARQKWVDQGISFNLYNKLTSLKFLNDIYLESYKSGLKSTYYLRNIPASKIQKVTSQKDNAEEPSKEVQEFAEKLRAAKAAAEMGQDCEMCQG